MGKKKRKLSLNKLIESALVSAIVAAIVSGLFSWFVTKDVNKIKVEIIGFRPVAIIHDHGQTFNNKHLYSFSFKGVVKLHNKGNVDTYFERSLISGYLPIESIFAMIIESHLVNGVSLDSLMNEFRNAIQKIKFSGVIDEPKGSDGFVIKAKKTEHIRVSFFEKQQAGARLIRDINTGPHLRSVSRTGNKSEIEGFYADPDPTQIFIFKRTLHSQNQLPISLRKEFTNGELNVSALISGKVIQTNPNKILPLQVLTENQWNQKSTVFLYDKDQFHLYQQIPENSKK